MVKVSDTIIKYAKQNRMVVGWSSKKRNACFLDCIHHAFVVSMPFTVGELVFYELAREKELLYSVLFACSNYSADILPQCWNTDIF